MSKLQLRRDLKILIGLAIALMSLVWAFVDVDAAALGRALRKAHYAWIGAAVLSVFLGVALIVWRWWFLLDRPGGGAEGWRHWRIMWHATMAAQVANIVVPLRLGDGVRVFVASQQLGVGPVRAGAAAVLERFADVMTLGVMGAALVFTDAAPPWARAALLGNSYTAVLVALVAVAAAGLVAWWTRRRIRFVPSTSALVAAAMLSAGLPLASLATNMLVIRAFGLQVPISAALVIVVVLQAGTAIVPVPAGLGVSQILTVKILDIWHVGASEALAFALVLYLVARVPKVLLMPFAVSTFSGRAVEGPSARS